MIYTLTLLILMNGDQFPQYGGQYKSYSECTKAGHLMRQQNYRIVQFNCTRI